MTLSTKVHEELKKGTGLSIVALLDALVSDGHRFRASDIHIHPIEKSIRVQFRIDGVLRHMYDFPKEIHDEVVSRIKILANLRIDEHQAAQDGRFRIDLGDDVLIDVRVSIVPTYYGQNAVLRLLTARAKPLSLEELGFSPSDMKKITDAARRPSGMILATGPTGSGKTTTLYSLIKLTDTSERSVVTIEDPIEYALEDIEQIQVNPRAGLSFANGLRSILRQDPDVVMVGEIRDSETANIAVNAALTGHLLLSTLHTNDAADNLPRLLDMGIEPYLIASTVNVVIGQRLVRRICTKCKTVKKLTPAETNRIREALPEALIGKLGKFYYGKGCEECAESGYSGRISTNEVLLVNEAIREAVLRKAAPKEIEALAVASGMTKMIEDGVQKIADGITTIDEVLRVLYDD